MSNTIELPKTVRIVIADRAVYVRLFPEKDLLGNHHGTVVNVRKLRRKKVVE